MRAYNHQMAQKFRSQQTGPLARSVNHYLAAAVILALCGCGGSGGSATSVNANPSSTSPATGSTLPSLPTGPLSYVSAFPAGKLPYPQHNPQFTSAQYEQMRKSNWILNNFSMYQGSDDGASSMYLHDGLDFMLDDGTPVYAVKTGHIQDISSDIITVDDPVKLETGWQMAHLVVDPRLKIGDQVFQGQYLGVVKTGNAHTHFNLLQRAESGSWFRNTKSSYPNDLFELIDAMAPEFNSSVRYFRNATDTPFNSADGLHGKIDIVVAARDLGPNHPSNYPVRSAPTTFSISIANDSGQIKWEHQSDLRKLILTPPFLGDADAAKHEVNLLFKKPNVMETGSWIGKGYLWWIISNLPNHQTPQVISTKDEDMFWDSAKKDDKGNAVFPNGSYTIKITAIDHNGNQASIVDKVRVNN